MVAWVAPLLATLAFGAAVTLASRLYRERWIRGLTAGLIWFSLILVPIHSLGWLEWLSRTSVALGTLVPTLAVLAAGLYRRPWVEAREALVDAVTAPARLVAEAWRVRHFAAVALLILYAFLAWSVIAAYLAPPCNWDGLVYHEPTMVNSIQNGGFRYVDAPESFLWQPVNWSPRVAEIFSLFFIYFGDRTFIEIGPTLTMPICVIGFVAVGRRQLGELNAVTWAVAFMLLPGLLLQVRSTYIDVIVLSIFLSITAYAAQPVVRLREVVLGALALGLFSGAKMTAVMIVPLFAGILWLRALHTAVRKDLPQPAALRRWAPVVLAVALPILTSLAIGGPTYLRNYEVEGNPLYPARLHYPALGIDLPGPFPPTMQMASSTFVEVLFAPPNEGGQFADTGDNGYGNLAPFTVLPLLFFAIPWMLARMFRREATDDRVLGLIALPAIASFAMSPAFYLARINTHVLAGMFWVTARFLGRGAPSQVLAAALVLAAVPTFYWSTPAWGITVMQGLELAGMSTRERVVQGYDMERCMDPQFTRAREQEIGDGDVVAYSTQAHTQLYWNESLTSEVRFVPPNTACPALLERLDELEAEWMIVYERGPHASCLERSGWERVGRLQHESLETAHVIVGFRRTSDGGAARSSAGD